MPTNHRRSILLIVLLVGPFLPAWAHASPPCGPAAAPRISFVELTSLDLEQQPPVPLTVKGKLSLPLHGASLNPCGEAAPPVPAVVILHGSGGVDFRGNFYADALNRAGIATLEIDMWEARGVIGGADRPPLPLFTYPDAFAALAFLSHDPRIDPARIGVLGFSWGGVVSLAAATRQNSDQFGQGLRFAAHVAHYPVCFAFNSGLPGSDFGALTGVPVLIQVGEFDDYDEGPAPCRALVAGLPAGSQGLVTVRDYPGAYHAWDRLEVPITVNDPFGHRGAGGEVRLWPDVDAAYASRRQVVRFMRESLSGHAH